MLPKGSWCRTEMSDGTYETKNSNFLKTGFLLQMLFLSIKRNRKSNFQVSVRANVNTGWVLKYFPSDIKISRFYYALLLKLLSETSPPAPLNIGLHKNRDLILTCMKGFQKIILDQISLQSLFYTLLFRPTQKINQAKKNLLFWQKRKKGSNNYLHHKEKVIYTQNTKMIYDL